MSSGSAPPRDRGSVRGIALSALADLGCVAMLVVIGTRNHDTDTGPAAVAAVGAPFVIAAAVGWTIARAWREPTSPRTATVVWACTVGVGMVLRNLAFDRGTAPAFVIVAALFLGATMWGWRAIARRRATTAQA